MQCSHVTVWNINTLKYLHLHKKQLISFYNFANISEVMSRGFCRRKQLINCNESQQNQSLVRVCRKSFLAGTRKASLKAPVCLSFTGMERNTYRAVVWSVTTWTPGKSFTLFWCAAVVCSRVLLWEPRRATGSKLQDLPLATDANLSSEHCKWRWGWIG